MTATPSADALLAAMEAAAQRVERYLDMRTKHPMRQLGQVIHAVHGGHEDAADLLLADLQAVMKALRASQEREAQAVAAEREACAKVADEFVSDADPDASAVIAAAIRARKDAAP